MRAAIRITNSVALLGLLFTSTGQAIDINWGEVQGSVNTTVSYGLGWRTEDRDPNRFAIGKVDSNGVQGTEFSNNGDDGNLNFDKHELYTSAAKVSSDINLQYGSFGIYARGYYLYDKINNSKTLHPNREVRKLAGERAEILDAYISADFSIGDRQGGIKVGRQIISWGEGTLIPGGININPLDLQRLRTPGAELRDILQPYGAAWALVGLTDTIDLEAYYQYEWEATTPEARGTFFSTNDFGTPGSDFLMLGFGSRAEGFPGATITRSPDRRPEDGGQGGIALTYMAEWLDYTEFRFYYANYHSRLPVASALAARTSPAGIAPNPVSTNYFIEYPEDIKMYGVSLNTHVGDWSLGAEYAFHQDAPFQIDDIDLLYRSLGLDSFVCGPTDPEVNNQSLCAGDRTYPGGGNYVQGFRRLDYSQVQFTLLNQFGPSNPLGADSILLAFEAGARFVHDFPENNEYFFEVAGTPTHPGAGFAQGHPLNPVTQNNEDFADEFSWGLRVIARPEYLNFTPGWTFRPRLVYFNDVKGSSPGPGGPFIEGRQIANVALNFEEAGGLAFDVGHTWYWGGGQQNRLSDRDNLTATISYKF